MGVKGLFQFLKRFEKDVHIPQYVVEKSVGVDMFWFLHRSKGDMFALQNSLLQIIKYAAEVHCVFDGAPSEEKKEYLEAAANSRQELRNSIAVIEKFLKHPFTRQSKSDRQHLAESLKELRQQVWTPTAEYIRDAKEWLKYKGCIIHQADGEADEYLINLEHANKIRVVITNDSDLLVLGSSKILRPTGPMHAKLFNTVHIRTGLGFTEQQWTDFMYLCKNIKENDIELAYSLISVYKELDYVFQKYNCSLRN
jgi:5'-3' exonuclease